MSTESLEMSTGKGIKNVHKECVLIGTDKKGTGAESSQKKHMSTLRSMEREQQDHTQYEGCQVCRSFMQPPPGTHTK
eukprot:1140727-Pelagomonas_calceolata.AAC.1